MTRSSPNFENTQLSDNLPLQVYQGDYGTFSSELRSIEKCSDEPIDCAMLWIVFHVVWRYGIALQK